MTTDDRLLARIRGEYREMPGLCLSVAQASRLWHLDNTTCLAVLKQLVTDRYLRRTDADTYVAFSAAHRTPATTALKGLDRAAARHRA